MRSRQLFRTKKSLRSVTKEGDVDNDLRHMAPGDLSPKGLLQRRELAKRSCDDSMQNIDGKKGILIELNRFVGAMSEGAKSSPPFRGDA